MPSLWPTKKKPARGSAARSWSRRRGSKKKSSSSSLSALWRRMVGPRRGTTRGKKPGLLSRAARVLSFGRRSY
jgi:hypothetical protein